VALSVLRPPSHPAALGLGAIRDDGPPRMPPVPVVGISSLADGGRLMPTDTDAELRQIVSLESDAEGR